MRSSNSFSLGLMCLQRREEEILDAEEERWTVRCFTDILQELLWKGCKPSKLKESKIFHIIIFKLHTGEGSNPPLPIYVCLKEKRPWTQYRNSFSDIHLQKKKKKENYNISLWVISPQFGIKVFFFFSTLINFIWKLQKEKKTDLKVIKAEFPVPTHNWGAIHLIIVRKYSMWLYDFSLLWLLLSASFILNMSL